MKMKLIPRLSLTLLLSGLIAGAYLYLGRSEHASRPGESAKAQKSERGSEEKFPVGVVNVPAGDPTTAWAIGLLPPRGGEDNGLTSAPARSVDALTDPPPTSPPLFPGIPATAWVQVGDRRTDALQPDQLGEFAQVYIQPKQEVEVRLRFPEAEPGAKFAASVEDGGRLPGERAVTAVTLDSNREGVFRFIADADPGLYRISVRLGTDWKIVKFWVDPAGRHAANL